MTLLALLDAGELRGPAKLLDGELAVDAFKELKKRGSIGDNLTGHHLPSANHMSKYGVDPDEGIAINMEQPKKGGRHRETFTYGTQADYEMSARDALAAGIRDLRKIYRAHGLYSKQVHDACSKIIEQNRAKFPDIFKKKP
jgi:filamentous hemagglutinin